jgi:hypothetical protein
MIGKLQAGNLFPEVNKEIFIELSKIISPEIMYSHIFYL